MTSILIIGGGGMIGQKIAWQLAREGIDGLTISEVTLFDQYIPDQGAPYDTAIKGEVDDPACIAQAIDARPDIIFHLAASVSGDSEKDFSLGWRVNMLAVWSLLESIRHAHETDGYCPRFVFASSCAAYGGPMPDIIPDNIELTPQSSYGTQKVVGELFVSDFSRKGYMDGLSLRLPTICVRPGTPNGAASACFSGIIREPLNGQEAPLPLPLDTRHMLASPRSAARYFRHAATLDTDLLNGVRGIAMPSLTCTIAQQIDSLRAFAGEDTVALIKPQNDPLARQIVQSWPTTFAADRARELGFTVEDSFDEILQIYVEEDLPQAAL